MSLNRNQTRVTTKETVVISDSSPENNRNWSELPGELTLMILVKLSAGEILESAQFVCKMWYILCKEPSMWQTIHIKYSPVPEISYMDVEKMMLKYEKMTLNAIDRSDGRLIDLSIENFGSADLCSSLACRSTQLKRLRLACCEDISDEALKRALESLSTLEEVEFTLCEFEFGTAYWIINSCPSLTTFKLNQLGSISPSMARNDEALAISENMPELRHLQLIGNGLTDDGLRVILDGCPRLESLDLRACFHIELLGNLGDRLFEQIKDFRHPYESTDDYKYVTSYDNITDTDDD